MVNITLCPDNGSFVFTKTYLPVITYVNYL